jgi:hypothetical protein
MSFLALGSLKLGVPMSLLLLTWMFYLDINVVIPLSFPGTTFLICLCLLPVDATSEDGDSLGLREALSSFLAEVRELDLLSMGSITSFSFLGVELGLFSFTGSMIGYV